ncbi:hypothetical protein, partial [Lysobacter sp. A3-1-A15]|uniref:hypothetical protein n=1 Tax=Novilysobacter viscosus TaxID=3098602 RepID=UPI002ED989EF
MAESIARACVAGSMQQCKSATRLPRQACILGPSPMTEPSAQPPQIEIDGQGASRLRLSGR